MNLLFIIFQIFCIQLFNKSLRRGPGNQLNTNSVLLLITTGVMLYESLLYKSALQKSYLLLRAARRSGLEQWPGIPQIVKNLQKYQNWSLRNSSLLSSHILQYLHKLHQNTTKLPRKIAAPANSGLPFHYFSKFCAPFFKRSVRRGHGNQLNTDSVLFLITTGVMLYESL